MNKYNTNPYIVSDIKWPDYQYSKRIIPDWLKIKLTQLGVSKEEFHKAFKDSTDLAISINNVYKIVNNSFNNEDIINDKGSLYLSLFINANPKLESFKLNDLPEYLKIAFIEEYDISIHQFLEFYELNKNEFDKLTNLFNNTFNKANLILNSLDFVIRTLIPLYKLDYYQIKYGNKKIEKVELEETDLDYILAKKTISDVDLYVIASHAEKIVTIDLEKQLAKIGINTEDFIYKYCNIFHSLYCLSKLINEELFDQQNNTITYDSIYLSIFSDNDFNFNPYSYNDKFFMQCFLEQYDILLVDRSIRDFYHEHKLFLLDIVDHINSILNLKLLPFDFLVKSLIDVDCYLEYIEEEKRIDEERERFLKNCKPIF